MTPNNKYIIIGVADYSIRIYDLETKLLVHTFENAHNDWVMGLCVSSDSRVVVSCSPDKSIIKWDLFTMKRLQILPEAHLGKSCPVGVLNLYLDWILCMVMSSDDNYIVTGSRDRSIQIYRFEDLHLIRTFHNVHIGKQLYPNSNSATPQGQSEQLLSRRIPNTLLPGATIAIFNSLI